jgi:D-beta-D-heptose 7-phosphate kinase/D-beta-D-heptose 1-phosphate adenosyltransferase
MTAVVVLGDVLLDRDVTGAAERLCPDAPVLVLTETTRTQRPGGAGLAAAMLALDGVEVTLVCGLGADEAGHDARQLLSRAGVRLVEIPYFGSTPEKIRLRAGRHPLMRLDRGDTPAQFGELPTGAVAAIRDGSAILVSDYGRGVTALPSVRRILADVTDRGTPVVWDPHPKGSTPVPGVRLACPNRAEATAFCAIHGADLNDQADGIAAEAALLRAAWRVSAVAVTVGSDGAILAEPDTTPVIVAAPTIHSGDTCGAGDRFAAAAVTGLADGHPISDAVAGAVHAASSYVAADGPETLTSKFSMEATTWLAQHRSW